MPESSGRRGVRGELPEGILADVVLDGFVRALDGFEAVLAGVAPGYWGAPSPCAGWSAADVAGHVIGDLRATEAMARGRYEDTGASDPGSAAGDDPLAAWRVARADMMAALDSAALARLVPGPWGQMPLGEILERSAMEFLVHTWDVAQATGQVAVLDPGLVHDALGPARQFAPLARLSGLVGPECAVPEDVKLAYRFGPRAMKKLTGRDPQAGNGIEPVEIWAHQPKMMMMGMGMFNQAVRSGKSVDERIKNLVELKGAQMIGCEYCVDLGSQICRNSGFSDEELLALPRYQSSALFTDREKAALDFTVAVMRTPVEVTDELFTRVRSYFDDRQLVEIAALLTLVNLDRFNAAFGIGAAGFSEGMVCVPPDRPHPAPSLPVPGT